MKSKKILIAAFLGISMAFALTSCIDDTYNIPDIDSKVPPLGHPITVQGLTDLCPPGNVYKFQGDTSLLAVVTMDDKSGNLYREAYVQDNTGGILVRLMSPGGLYQGDSIYINLNGLSIKYYRQVFQIDSVDVDRNIVKLATRKTVAADTIAIPNLSSFDYQAQLIHIKDVQFIISDTSKTFADADNLEYGELYIQDTDGNAVMLRTSGYSKFARQNVPNGKGSITAIAGRYGNTVQLAIRGINDVQMDTPRWDMFEGYEKISISDLKDKFTGSLLKIEDEVFIEAIVVANDESSNYYRTLVVQDETSGIEVKIFQTNLFRTYPVGTKIKIRLKDLYIGAYGGLVQLGYIYNNGIGSIEANMIPSHFEIAQYDLSVSPMDITISEFANEHLGKLIRLSNVEFAADEIGNTFASTSAATNRNLIDCEGNSVIVRTSNYAKFQSEFLPYGNGEMIAILSKFNTTYQLMIRDAEELIMNGERCTDAPFYIELFTSSLSNYKAYSILGSQVWNHQAWDGGAAVMTGFQNFTNYENDDWLVSPAIDLTGKTNVILNIREAINHVNPAIGVNDMEVLISNNYSGGDPSISGTWVKLSGFNRPPGNNWTFVNSGDIDISEYDGATINVAFRYLSNTTKAATWQVSKVVLWAD